jgi:hypothetical protein
MLILKSGLISRISLSDEPDTRPNQYAVHPYSAVPVLKFELWFQRI